MVKLCPALRVRPAPWHSPPYRVPAFAPFLRNALRAPFLSGLVFFRKSQKIPALNHVSVP